MSSVVPKKSKHTLEKVIAVMILAAVLLLAHSFLSRKASAADEQGAYTELKARAEGYQADRQTTVWEDDMDGSDTLATLDDPDTKFSSDFSRMLALRDTSSQSYGTKVDLTLSCRFSIQDASATFWVVYYYYDGTTWVLKDVDQPGAGGVITAHTDDPRDGGLYMAKTETMDTYGATHALILCTNVSSGTVDVWAGTK